MRSNTIVSAAYASGARFSSSRPCSTRLYSNWVSSAGSSAASVRVSSLSGSVSGNAPGTACSMAICCNSAVISSSVPAADKPMLAQRIDAGQHRTAVARGERTHEPAGMAAVDAAEHRAHRIGGQRAAAEGDRLVGQRQRIAHRAARGARQQAQRQLVVRHASACSTCCRCSRTTSGAIGRRLNCRQRDSTVGSIFSGSVVASTNFRYSGGSSSVFSSALNDSLVSWCASSIMKTLKRPIAGL